MWCGLVYCFSKLYVPLRILLKCRICFNRSDWALRLCISNMLPTDDSFADCWGNVLKSKGYINMPQIFFHLTLRYLRENDCFNRGGIFSPLLDLWWTLAPKNHRVRKQTQFFYCRYITSHVMYLSSYIFKCGVQINYNHNVIQLISTTFLSCVTEPLYHWKATLPFLLPPLLI